MFTKETVESIFKGDIIGKEIIFFDSVTSTNDKAFEIGRMMEDPDGVVVIADKQTHGKGRHGRSWISPQGVNLYLTVLLKPPFPSGELQVLPLIFAVAVVNTIRDYTRLNATIKWPNDILVNNRKTGGILLEMKSGGGRVPLLAIGIGINVNMSLDEIPQDIRTFTTSLIIENNASVDRTGILRKLLAELEKTYKILLIGDKRALINEWYSLNSTIGNEVSVRCRDKLISGTAENINERGELMIKLPTGRIETVNSGEVTILKNQHVTNRD